MESRKLNISFSKSGSGSINAKLSVPKTWLDKLEITPEEREIELTLDEENKKLILEKLKK